MTISTPSERSLAPIKLPLGMVVFERGWLSSNSILIQSEQNCALVDSGYATHSDLLCSLLMDNLGGRPLDTLLNTHLHSDHCGGNAMLQERFPGMQTLIPPGQAHLIEVWDRNALSFEPTGQTCHRFSFGGLLQPGKTIQLGANHWQIHSAPGHDPHSVILFEPESRVLLSADALWESGFGIIFPELEGIDAFNETACTLDLIESLNPSIVIPGHGKPFNAVNQALKSARQRLQGFVSDPKKHAHHAAKVLLKFKLLELQRENLSTFLTWASRTDYLNTIRDQHFPEVPMADWLDDLMSSLYRSNVARRIDQIIVNV